MHRRTIKQTISDRKIQENIKIYIWIDLFAYMYMHICPTWLSDVEVKAKPPDNAMVINEPAKPIAGSSKHPDNADVIDGELRY